MRTFFFCVRLPHRYDELYKYSRVVLDFWDSHWLRFETHELDVVRGTICHLIEGPYHWNHGPIRTLSRSSIMHMTQRKY